jgi:NTE family protein
LTLSEHLRVLEEGNRLVLVLSGGVGLGAYHAGACSKLLECGCQTGWISSSSTGTVQAALIAGTAPEHRHRVLRRFWFDSASELDPPWMHPAVVAWSHAIVGRFLGVVGQFRPRLYQSPTTFKSVYDVHPLRQHLMSLIDFERLNSGEIRLSIAATDIESGEPVVFDTADGVCIGIDHILASCALLPDFPPVELDGRRLGDGGLSANAPIEPVLMNAKAAERITCLVVDAFSRNGRTPVTFEEAMERRNDLVFANQTLMRLAAYEREQTLRTALQHVLAALPPDTVAVDQGAGADIEFLRIAYQSPAWEAGSEKLYDYSRKSLTARWNAGEQDIERILPRITQSLARS